MDKVFFSIILPTFNRYDTLSTAIDSVRSQSYEKWELLVVDDKSTDDTVTNIKNSFGKDKRIRIFQHDNNMGVSVARNTGIENTTGDYILFLDSDDFFREDALSVLNQHIISQDYPEIISFGMKFGGGGNLYPMSKD